MSGWKTFCETFNAQQADDKQFPFQCDVNTSQRSLQEVLRLISNIGQYDATLKKLSNSEVDANRTDLTNALQSNVYTFCCAAAERQRVNEMLEDAKEDYEVAKNRVKSVRDPAAAVSDRGTSFPFGRSLRPDSVPILLTVTLSFLILSLGLILQLGNIQIAYKGPVSVGPSFFEVLAQSYESTNKWLLIIIALLAAGGAAGIFYAITKNKPELIGLKTSEEIS